MTNDVPHKNILNAPKTLTKSRCCGKKIASGIAGSPV